MNRDEENLALHFSSKEKGSAMDWVCVQGCGGSKLVKR